MTTAALSCRPHRYLGLDVSTTESQHSDNICNSAILIVACSNVNVFTGVNIN